MKTILVVEDNSDIREEICDIFKMGNYNVLEASDGLHGYNSAIINIPDLIISDIKMPRLDGIEMYKKLRKNHSTETIPFIFLTAMASLNDIKKGMNLGIDNYLTKPIAADDLIDVVDRKLKKYEEIDQKIESLKINILDILQHEVRTPLNGIVGFSDYIKERLNEMKISELDDVIDNLCQSGKRLHNLAEKYLYFAELKMNSFQNNKIKELKKGKYINSLDIISHIVDEYEALYKRKNVVITDLDDVDIRFDEDQFVKLISELVENSFKFSEKGSVIKITSCTTMKSFKITFENEGLGMTSDQINNIDDFKQFNKRLLAQNGSGIGLSIVNLIASIYDLEFEIVSSYKKNLSATLVFKDSFRKR